MNLQQFIEDTDREQIVEMLTTSTFGEPPTIDEQADRIYKLIRIRLHALLEGVVREIEKRKWEAKNGYIVIDEINEAHNQALASHLREGISKTTECCDGECNHDDCCGKIPENCTHVSQSVEEDSLDQIVRDCTSVEPRAKSEIRRRIQALIDSSHKGSQSVEGWEKRFDNFLSSKEMHSLICGHANGEGKWEIVVKRIKQNFLSAIFTTLVKEMEGKLKHNYAQLSPMMTEKEVGFNAGISAAVEVVKKMGV